MRTHRKLLSSMAAFVGAAALTMSLAAGQASALPPPGGGPGVVVGGEVSTPPPPPADNIVSFSGNSYLGSGHGQTAAGVLNRTTNTLSVTTTTTAGWCYAGWHGASQVIIDDASGHTIWASPELGPVGVDGPACPFQISANATSVTWPAMSVPAAVAQQAGEIDVFNFWDPQWTGVNTVLTLLRNEAGPSGGFLSASAISSLCSASPACRAATAGLFGPIL
jgi:hypothetical protein